MDPTAGLGPKAYEKRTPLGRSANTFTRASASCLRVERRVWGVEQDVRSWSSELRVPGVFVIGRCGGLPCGREGWIMVVDVEGGS